LYLAPKTRSFVVAAEDEVGRQVAERAQAGVGPLKREDGLAEVRVSAREYVPLPRRHLPGSVLGPEDAPSWSLKVFRLVAIAALGGAERLGEASDHRSGEHPGRYLTPAAEDQRQVEELGGGGPAGFVKNTAHPHPFEAGPNDQATDNRLSLGGSEGHSARVTTGLDAEDRSLRPPGDIQPAVEAGQGLFVRPDERVHERTPATVALSRAEKKGVQPDGRAVVCGSKERLGWGRPGTPCGGVSTKYTEEAG